MTAIVGVLCRDGVVIGADSSTTFTSGNIRTVEQPSEKISIIGDHVILVGTGQVGLGQRFGEVLKKAWENKAFKGSAIDAARGLCQQAVNDFASTRANQGQYGALVGFPVENRPHLCEFAILDFQPEFKTEKLWYCSMGSAQPITDTFLAFIREVLWKDGPPAVADAIFAVTWTLDLAVKVNPGGVNAPIRLSVLRKDKSGHFVASILSEEELAETFQSAEAMKEHIRSFKAQYAVTAEPPKVPLK